LTTVIISGRWI